MSNDGKTKSYTVCKAYQLKKGQLDYIGDYGSSPGKKDVKTRNTYSSQPDCNITNSTGPISPPHNTSSVSPQATPSEVLRTRFVIIRPIVPMVREAVCDLTAMGWVIILYDCLIQAHTSSSILVFYQYYKPTGVSSPPHVDLTRIAILSTCSIRRSGIPIPAVVCDLTAMG